MNYSPFFRIGNPLTVHIEPRFESNVSYTREFKQIATAGATTAAVIEKVWGEYVASVCQILAK